MEVWPLNSGSVSPVVEKSLGNVLKDFYLPRGTKFRISTTAGTNADVLDLRRMAARVRIDVIAPASERVGRHAHHLGRLFNAQKP